MEATGVVVDRLARLYTKVDESETPLPRVWSAKDKYTYIGLSQSNLRVHYKGGPSSLPFPMKTKLSRMSLSLPYRPVVHVYSIQL